MYQKEYNRHHMSGYRFLAVILLAISIGLGFFVYNTEKGDNPRYRFALGLDLNGGSNLTYSADTSKTKPEDVKDAMESLRQTVERRINIFGVSEPLVQTEKGSSFGSKEDENRLIVELPGVTNIDDAVKAIGKTPKLEFKLIVPAQDGTSTIAFKETGLTGALLKRANLFFGQTNEPTVSVQFNEEGTKLFADITTQNIGKPLAIFLDDQVISSPTIRESITGGEAQISGNFTAEEAKQLVRDLNFGALPLPVKLIQTEIVGSTLGSGVAQKGISALLWAYLLVSIFMIVWYRLPGFTASLSLAVYVVIMLTFFKLIPVTLTAAGIAGLIMSIGMAVDANVLIFERMREELSRGSSVRDAIKEGASRAWPSIRDSNLTSILSAIVLFWLSGASVVKGFALVFGLGVIASMFTAIVVSRTFLLAIAPEKLGKVNKFLFGSALKNIK